MRDHAQRAHVALVRLYVVAVYLPLTRYVIRPLAARLDRR